MCALPKGKARRGGYLRLVKAKAEKKKERNRRGFACPLSTKREHSKGRDDCENESVGK